MEKSSTKTAEKETVIAGATPAEIKAWKERYGENKLHLITIPEEDGEAALEFIARTPDRKTLAEIEKWAEKDPNKAKEIAINACVLTRKEEVKNNDYYFLSAYVSLSRLVKIEEAQIKNL
jgi:cobalamin biosynthesis protein CbiD